MRHPGRRRFSDITPRKSGDGEPFREIQLSVLPHATASQISNAARMEINSNRTWENSERPFLRPCDSIVAVTLTQGRELQSIACRGAPPCVAA
jgi:hypothetical protein